MGNLKNHKNHIKLNYYIIFFLLIVSCNTTTNNSASSEIPTADTTYVEAPKEEVKPSNPVAIDNNQQNNAKPKMCDCTNFFLRDIENAAYYGNTEPSEESKYCELFFTAEELLNADCGLTKYDPNFKAR